MNSQVSIIILNWNGWEDTLECLDSLYRIEYPDYNVVLIDNGSEDESIEKIKEYCGGEIEVHSKFFKNVQQTNPIEIWEISEKDALKNNFQKKEEFMKQLSNKKLILIKNNENYGFAGGNNVGIDFVINNLNSEYVLFLNNDTVVDKDFLTEMVKTAKSTNVGMVGSKIYYYDYEGKDNVIWALGGGGMNLKTGFVWHNKFRKEDIGGLGDNLECGFITGCSLLIKKDILHKLKGFDKDYFCYFEDADLSARCKKLGYKLLCACKSKVRHKVSASSGEYSPFLIYMITRNNLYFVKKNHGSKIYCLIYLLTFRLFGRLFRLGMRNELGLIKYYFKGIYDGLKI
ncbi:glycosyl transferase, family 2 [Methanococcus maripaludis C5]|uniref:Glycosyl transferase, family 2 n=1 Tax=Methanococcus maripaludis (strain C5 / ATCC BAA-1333) TaxID=402880 RepID=A4FZH4_METM5|nr:glycosyltransferase family 2 protein [Methanococcus maripaludis]ABO35608.1 glycosyl transferase, family 2 [Methanococcus maripaludis C5]